MQEQNSDVHVTDQSQSFSPMLAQLSKSNSPINDFSVSNIEASPSPDTKSKEEITEYNRELQWALKILKEENDQIKLHLKIQNPELASASPDQRFVSPSPDNDFGKYSEFQSASAGVASFKPTQNEEIDLRKQTSVDEIPAKEDQSQTQVKEQPAAQTPVKEQPTTPSPFKVEQAPITPAKVQTDPKNSVNTPIKEKTPSELEDEQSKLLISHIAERHPDEFAKLKQSSETKMALRQVEMFKSAQKERGATDLRVNQNIDSGVKSQHMRMKEHVVSKSYQKGGEESEFEKSKNNEPILIDEIRTRRSKVFGGQDTDKVSNKWTPKKQSKFGQAYNKYDEDADPQIWNEKMHTHVENRAKDTYVQHTGYNHELVQEVVDKYSRTNKHHVETLDHINTVYEAAHRSTPIPKKLKKKQDEVITRYQAYAGNLGFRKAIY